MKVGIINITGYAGSELARILYRHPEVEVTSVTGRSAAGQQLNEVFPHLASMDMTIEAELSGSLDLVFSALPHKASAEACIPVLEQGVKVVEEEQALTAYNMIAEEFLNSLDEAAVAIYNHPAGKEHSLNAALQKLRADGATGIEKEKLGKLLNALAKWAKSQGLKVNEEIENSVTNQLDERSQALRESIETNRWKVISGIK